MADLVTRLLLQTQQFDNNLGKATKEIQGFQKSMKGISSVASSLGNYAKALGVAYGAAEIFNKAMNSNVTIQNAYNDVMETGSRVTDQFFTAIMSGDWTQFNNGILTAIKNAKEYNKQYRYISRMSETSKIRNEEIDSKKNQLESIIEDSSKPLEERKAAANELYDLLNKGIAENTKKAGEMEEKLRGMLGNLGLKNFGDTKSAQRLIVDLRDPSSELSKTLEEYQKYRQPTLEDNPIAFDRNKWSEANTELNNRYSKEEQAKYDSYLLVANQLTDETFKSLKNVFDEWNGITDTFIGTFKKDIAGARDTIASAEKGTGNNKTKVDEVIPNGSIAEIENRIKALKESFTLATSDAIRINISQSISEAETQLEMMRLRAKGTPLIVSVELKTEGRNATDDIESGYIPQLEPIVTNESIKANDDFTDSLNGIATMMNSITQLTNDGVSAWVTWGATVLSTTAAAIPAITTMIGLKKTEAVANAAASASQTPIVGWVLGIAAIASMIAALASIPSFSTGGIFTGNNTIGDKNIARVNSGEMILNNRQQRNLFNLLNGNGTNSLSSGQVEFKVKGSDLVGVLSNYNNKKAKVR